MVGMRWQKHHQHPHQQQQQQEWAEVVPMMMICSPAPSLPCWNLED
jgi:hypothetical protein